MRMRRHCFEKQWPSFPSRRRRRIHAVALAALGEAQIEGGLTTDALDTLLQANSLFEKLHPNMSPDRADLLVSLARAQIAGGRAEEAVASADQAATFWRSFDPANRNTAVATLWHARALYGSRRRAESSRNLAPGERHVQDHEFALRARAARADPTRNEEQKGPLIQPSALLRPSLNSSSRCSSEEPAISSETATDAFRSR